MRNFLRKFFFLELASPHISQELNFANLSKKKFLTIFLLIYTVFHGNLKLRYFKKRNCLRKKNSPFYKFFIYFRLVFLHLVLWQQVFRDISMENFCSLLLTLLNILRIFLKLQKFLSQILTSLKIYFYWTLMSVTSLFFNISYLSCHLTSNITYSLCS